jgi:hypothetical protein
MALSFFAPDPRLKQYGSSELRLCSSHLAARFRTSAQELRQSLCLIFSWHFSTVLTLKLKRRRDLPIGKPGSRVPENVHLALRQVFNPSS